MKKVEVIIEEVGVGNIGYEKKREVIEYKDEKDLINKCLLVEFGSEESILKYWNEWYGGIESVEEVVDMVVEEVECMRENEDWDGSYGLKEDVFFRVI
jgi:hypothetical protein